MSSSEEIEEKPVSKKSRSNKGHSSEKKPKRRLLPREESGSGGEPVKKKKTASHTESEEEKPKKKRREESGSGEEPAKKKKTATHTKSKKEKSAPELSDTEEKILSYLQEEKGYVPTLQIAKAVVGKEGRASDVNPSLYRLKSQNMVNQKAEEGGKKPRWSAT